MRAAETATGRINDISVTLCVIDGPSSTDANQVQRAVQIQSGRFNFLHRTINNLPSAATLTTEAELPQLT